MKAENSTRIQFDSLSSNEAYARGVTAAFLARYDPTVPQLADLKTAVSEAVTNCIVHAYPERIGPVCMTIAVYPDREVHITITDKGIGIPQCGTGHAALVHHRQPGGTLRSGLCSDAKLYGQGQGHLKARQGNKGAAGQASVPAGAYIKKKGGPVYGNG